MEKFVVWQAEFSVGNSSLDDQHRELFELVNRIWEGRKESDKKKRQLFDRILKTLRQHCDDEELVLARNACPDVESHRREHRKLIKQIQEALESCDKDCKKTWYHMMTFLTHELLSRHLIGVDMKCRKYLRG